MALDSDTRVGNTAADAPAKLQWDAIILGPILATFMIHKIQSF